jgi:hypothetical protein
MNKDDATEGLSIFAEWFEEDHPSGYFTRGGGYESNWKLTVEHGVGILSVVLEDVNSLDTAEFEWTLNLRS